VSENDGISANSTGPKAANPLELQKATCIDCVGFAPTGQRNEENLRLGHCRKRREIGTISEDYPYCRLVQLRSSRIGKVLDPVVEPVAGEKRRRSSKRSGNGSRQNGTRTMPQHKTKHRTLRNPATGDVEGEITVDRQGLKQIIRELLTEETMYGFPDMARKWEGGSLVMKPGDGNLQDKAVSIEAFFHKVVMVRDRLRVLESKINSHSKLTENEKVDMQGYITKAYGSLTTFNVLFDNKSDHFSSR